MLIKSLTVQGTCNQQSLLQLRLSLGINKQPHFTFESFHSYSESNCVYHSNQFRIMLYLINMCLKFTADNNQCFFTKYSSRGKHKSHFQQSSGLLTIRIALINNIEAYILILINQTYNLLYVLYTITLQISLFDISYVIRCYSTINFHALL